ncbi:hypothetical protein GWK47_037552 [Chionoecetes opilio]|uniref:Uncharacterized protein n=1 Tax=Chionoecetes opilio TaxID=41210 RepID=A0A8J4YLP1_CHIOP|nr:hypothetical protein GWK47_037552 [Chionoecetes opilio]
MLGWCASPVATTKGSSQDSRGFYEFHRMSKDNFVKLLNLVSPLIRKQDTKLRKAVSPAQRLSVTLRYLATVLRGTYLKLPTNIC